MPDDGPRYPHVIVPIDLSGPGGNAYAIMGAVKLGLKQAKVSKERIDEFLAEAMSADYAHLLETAFEWVTLATPNWHPVTSITEIMNGAREGYEKAPVVTKDEPKGGSDSG